jgi:16S rRNA processing protein RimM
MPGDASTPARATPENLIVGQVVAPFGIKGELKVNIITEFPERFRKLEQVVLAPFEAVRPGHAPTSALDPSTLRSSPSGGKGGGRRAPRGAATGGPATFDIESTHFHKGQLLLKLAGVDSVDAAEALRGHWVMVPVAEARKLPRGAYYLYQLVGLEVYTTAGEHIGRVEDVLTTAGNDVYVVRGPKVKEPAGELLVPAVRSVVRRVELKRGRLVIVPPEEWA